jgi:hypothetical protein
MEPPGEVLQPQSCRSGHAVSVPVPADVIKKAPPAISVSRAANVRKRFQRAALLRLNF